MGCSTLYDLNSPLLHQYSTREIPFSDDVVQGRMFNAHAAPHLTAKSVFSYIPSTSTSPPILPSADRILSACTYCIQQNRCLETAAMTTGSGASAENPVRGALRLMLMFAELYLRTPTFVGRRHALSPAHYADTWRRDRVKCYSANLPLRRYGVFCTHR